MTFPKSQHYFSGINVKLLFMSFTIVSIITASIIITVSITTTLTITTVILLESL